MMSNLITSISGIVTIGLISSSMISTVVSAGCRTTYDTLINFIPEKVTLEETFEYITKNDIVYKIQRMNNVISDIRNMKNDNGDIKNDKVLSQLSTYSISAISAIDVAINHLQDVIDKASNVISKLNKYKEEQESLYFGNWSIRQYNCREELSELIYYNSLFDIRFEDLQKIINIYKRM